MHEILLEAGLAARHGRCSMTTLSGVDHVGVGVGDIDEAIEFYGRHVGFDQLLFDFTGDLPGLEQIAGRSPRARVAMLASSSATPVGPGRVKLVQVLDGDGPPPVPSGQAWGEVGVCEICLHVRDVQGVHDALVAAGCESLMAPMAADVPPNGVSLDIAYVADPWGTKLEMIEWTGLWRSLPGPARAEGVNHVAFGVTDMARSRAFYEALGFTELLFESVDFFDPDGAVVRGAVVRPGPAPEAAHDDADAEPGRGDRAGRARPARPRLPRRVGASRPDGLRDPASRTWSGAIAALRPSGIETLGEPAALDVGTGEWRYVYLVEPDGNYVALTEARY